MLQYYLCPSKAIQLTERFAEMNRPVPFMANLSEIGDEQIQLPSIFLRHFCNLFDCHERGQPPFLLSFGCGGVKGKSQFLNKAFGCRFPVQSSGPFHDQSIDVAVSTEHFPLPFHILDFHGTPNQPIIHTLTGFCEVAMVHVSKNEVKGLAVSGQESMLTAIDPLCSIILLVHIEGPTYDDEIKVAEIEQNLRVKQHSFKMHIVAVPKLAEGDDFEMTFATLLECTLRPILANICPSNPSKSYGQLEDFLRESQGTSCNVISRLPCCTELATAMTLQLQPLLLNCDVATQLFPYTAMNNRRVRIEDELKRLQLNAPMQQAEAENNMRLEIVSLDKRLTTVNQCHVLLWTFIRVLLSSDIDQYEEFISQIRSLKIKGIRLAAEQFWHETMLAAKFMTIEQKKCVIEAARAQLCWGHPQEVLNGDSLSIADLHCLKEILTSDKSGQDSGVLVCSVIGPQSSAKSTLVNYLFGSSFQVCAGRCTKGMHMSIFDARKMGVRNLSKLLVLDTEGLMSSTSRDTAFDKQMTLMALALSNVVLINIKGEIGKEMSDVLYVTFFALKQLSIIHAKPQILFVLRDMTDLGKSRQLEAIDRIRADMKEICDKIQFEFSGISEDNFILLPPAINLIDKRNVFFSSDGFSRNGTFSSKIGELLATICSTYARNTSVAGDLPFNNLSEWLRHFDATWISVKQSGQMMHYKSLQEYFDRKLMSSITTTVCRELSVSFIADVKVLVQRLLACRRTTPSAIKDEFLSMVDTVLVEKHIRTAETSFNRLLQGRHLVPGIEEEYRRCLKQRGRILREQALSDFDLQHEYRNAEIFCQQGIAKIKEWIDANVVADSTNSVSLDVNDAAGKFEKFWSSQRKVLEHKLSAMVPETNSNIAKVHNAFLGVSNLHPDSQRYDVCFNNMRYAEDFTRLQKAMLPKAKGRRASCVQQYIVGTNCISKMKQWWGDDSKMYAHFVSILDQVTERVNDTVLKLDCFDGIEVIVLGMYLLLNEASDQLSNKMSCRLTADFYSICLSFTFYSIVQQTEIMAQKRIENILVQFDKNEAVLKKTYNQLVNNRFDDANTVTNLVELVVEKILSLANAAAETDLQNELALKCSLTAETLSEMAELRQSSSDIFKYVTDFPRFLTSLFCENHDAELKHLLPLGNAKLSNLCKQNSQMFLQSVDIWNQVVSMAINHLCTEVTSPKLRRELNHWCFGSLKAYLCQQPQPHLSSHLDTKMKNIFEKLLEQPALLPFEQLFDTVPNSFAICDPVKFCTDLRTTTFNKLSGASMQLQLNENGPIKRTKERQLREAIGCYKMCPLCKAKCSNNNEGHAVHSTDTHRLTAFAGWHNKGTRNFVFYICTSLVAQNSEYYPTSDSENTVSFTKLMAMHNWRVALHDYAKVENRNIFRWLKVRRQLCQFYDLDDNTPSDWLKMEEGVCPICQSLWNDSSCGNKHQLPCNHYIGSLCYGKLLAQPRAAQKCPVCRKDLPE